MCRTKKKYVYLKRKYLIFIINGWGYLKKTIWNFHNEIILRTENIKMLWAEQYYIIVCVGKREINIWESGVRFGPQVHGFCSTMEHVEVGSVWLHASIM